MNTVAGGFGYERIRIAEFGLERQHEVVHPADSRNDVAQTGRHTRPQDGRNSEIVIGYEIVAWLDSHGFTFEIVIEKALLAVERFGEVHADA